MPRASISILATILAVVGLDVCNARAIVTRGDPQPTCQGDGCVAAAALPFKDWSSLNDESLYELPDDQGSLCRRAPGVLSCSSPKQPSWYLDNNTQKKFSALTEQEKQGIWTEAGEKGTKLKLEMDTYVSRGSSRLAEEKSDQDERFRKHYDDNDDASSPGFPYEYYYPGTNVQFRQAGIKDVDVSYGFDQVAIKSKDSPGDVGNTAASVVIVGASKSRGTMLSTFSFAKNDINPPMKRAYSSTLTWNAWKQQAADDASKLKYQMRHQVSNSASLNIMNLAHERYPQNVDQIPTMDRPFTTNGPRTGHGRWTPEDPAYAYLLAMPNIQTCVQMVIDYNPQMDNPYISVIHTFPEVLGTDFPMVYDRHTREGYIIIEYGPYPGPPAADAAKPVETF